MPRVAKSPNFGKRNSRCGRNQFLSSAKAGLLHLRHDVGEILLDEMRQHVAVVQLGAPARQSQRLVGFAPESRHHGAQQQLLREAHALMRRHLEGPQLQQSQSSGGAIRRIHLVDGEFGAMRVAAGVDQQVAEQAVHQPRRAGFARRRHLLERDLQFVQRIVARLVDARRLRGGSDEQAGEQIGQRRMVVPIGQQAAQQVRPAQERRIRRRFAAEHEVIAAAGAGVATVEHELLGGQPRLARLRHTNEWCGRPARPSWTTDGC